MIAKALKRVLGNAQYFLLAFLASAALFAFAVWLPNLGLITAIASSDATLLEKVAVPVSLLGSIATNFTLLSAVATVSTAVLFGVNIALLVYFLNRRAADVMQSGATVGLAGLLSGVIGVGCAACGSFLLTSGLSLVGAAGLLTFLPLEGAEFGLLAVALLIVSIYLTAKQIEKPLVCD